MKNFSMLSALCILTAAMAHVAPANPAEARIMEAALESDDQCSGSEGKDCTLSALQLRGDKVVPGSGGLAAGSGYQDTGPGTCTVGGLEASKVQVALGGTATQATCQQACDDLDECYGYAMGGDGCVLYRQGPLSGGGPPRGFSHCVVKSPPPQPPAASGAVDVPGETADVTVIPDLELDLDPMTSGGENPDYIRSMCQGTDGYCNLGGYMIVPRRQCPGMECINGGNANYYDQFMRAAYMYCSDPSCVLITNPVGYRSQNQLHIHYRHMTGQGHNLKERLQHQLCHSIGGWQSFHECGTGKARLFPSLPGAFSVTAAEYGGGSMANIGITVWPGSCGNQVIILATTHCSLEHSISPR